MGAPVVHWEISSGDYKKAQAFYQQVFDWKIQEHEGMPYALVAPEGEGSIGGGIGATQEGQGPSITFYVSVDDLQAYLDKAEAAGGKAVMPPTPIPGVGSCAMFADPDGNVIGLFKGMS
jgi:predicted enzyme related to lactoylglutathione lyase